MNYILTLSMSMWKFSSSGSNQYKISIIVLYFWNIKKTSNSKYKTDNPKSIRQTAGWGLVNGPFGNANTDTTRKKNITHNIPCHTFWWKSFSSLQWIENKIRFEFTGYDLHNLITDTHSYLTNAKYMTLMNDTAKSVIVWGL